MRKGQAAMEFLMTYGWAILVVIAAIAALAYFGVLDPARLLPEKCEFPAGIDCVDKASVLANGTVTLAFKNNIGFPITLSGEISDDSSSGGDCSIVGNSTQVKIGTGSWSALGDNATSSSISNNQGFLMLFNCGTQSTGKFKADLTLTYTNSETGLSHPAVGSVRGKV